MSRTGCEELRALAPELALGVASGDERARALEHLSVCPSCRRHVEELSGLADELLLLSPTQEPPAGFETRVLERMRPPRERSRRGLAAVAAAAVGAAAAALGMWIALAGDRDLASRYQEIFARADGTYFVVQPLSAPGGEVAGRVFGYQGRPSWVQVVVDPEGPLHKGRYHVQVIDREGERIRLDPIRITGGIESRGESIPIDLDDVAEVRLIGPGRGNVLQAKFGAWSNG